MLVAAGLLLPTGVARADVSYYYDDLGRLVEASDPASKNATLYSYDLAGNITSVVNSAWSTLALSALAPASGNVGSTVILTGTGFSTTAASNDVEFTGGVRGTVLGTPAPTATQMSVTVPSGAKTGVVTVKVGSVTASSPGPFTVTAGTGAPTITSFTPTEGPSGTSVQITGTHFDPVAGNDRVAFNNGYATVTAASATSLTVAVPSSATSGPIQVGTVNGSAVSSQVFVVPTQFFLPLQNVPITGTVTPLVIDGGSSAAVSYSAGNYSLLTFSGSAGQYLALGMSGLTGSSCTVIVAAPNGQPLWIKGSSGASSTSVALTASGQGIQLPRLTANGTYSILVSAPSGTGSAKFSLAGPTPGTALTMGGSSVSVNMATPGQRGLVTLQGGKGAQYSLTASNSSMSRATLSLIGPDGTVVLSNTISSGTGTVGTFQPQLPLDGVYTVLVEPAGAISGSLSLALNGLAASLQSTVAQPISFTSQFLSSTQYFADTAGDFPAINFTSTVAATANLTGPDGRRLFTSFSIPAGTSVVMNPGFPAPLSASGVYSLQITASAPGQVTVTFSAAAPAVISLNNGSASPATRAPSQWLDTQFYAPQGKFGAVAVNSSKGGTYEVLSPYGAIVASGAVPAGNAQINLMPSAQSPQALPATGMYQLLLQQPNTYGTVTLTASTALQDPPQALLLSGAALGDQTTYTGQWMQLVFANPTTQSLTLAVTGSATSPAATVFVLDPNGNVVATTAVPLHGGTTLPLPNLSGTTSNYTVLAQPAVAGLLTFQLKLP